VQKHWFINGQHGCVFAQVIAKRAEQLGWEQLVIGEELEEITHQTLFELDQAITRSTNDPACQLLSFLFPAISAPDALAVLVSRLICSDRIYIGAESLDEEFATIGLRTIVGTPDVVAWIIGFSPAASMPATRRAPCTEIIIRVKPKQAGLYERLNQDFSTAHLADVRLPAGTIIYDRLWDETIERTARILGTEPREYANAKATFRIFKDHWREAAAVRSSSPTNQLDRTSGHGTAND